MYFVLKCPKKLVKPRGMEQCLSASTWTESHTEEQVLHDLHGAEPDFTGLKVCSITSDERPREENKTEERENYTALNPEKKRLLICKKSHITSFIIYIAELKYINTTNQNISEIFIQIFIT